MKHDFARVVLSALIAITVLHFGKFISWPPNQEQGPDYAMFPKNRKSHLWSVRTVGVVAI